jgi:hypothetical protein
VEFVQPLPAVEPIVPAVLVEPVSPSAINIPSATTGGPTVVPMPPNPFLTAVPAAASPSTVYESPADHTTVEVAADAAGG